MTSLAENRDRMLKLQAALIAQVEHRLRGVAIADSASCTVIMAIRDLSMAIQACDTRIRESK